MFLQSIDIFGFKSFAKRTHIDFSEGITALLGQNGCGKSNIVDAVKWVLSENRVKALRAQKREDVIFNGTQKLPPLNVAEVTLTMSNERLLLPLPDALISIKRRLYRTGENEYFINGKPIGARDVTKLFMDTGIGKSAYSVMEQGRIDQVLSSRPEDRRYLFEEAAAISGSKAQVAEAERNLEVTKANLSQIEVALTEIKKRYDVLKVQAEKAECYRATKDEIFAADTNIALLKLAHFVALKTEGAKRLQDAEVNRDKAQSEVDKINSNIGSVMDLLKALQEEVFEKQNEAIKLQTQKSGKEELLRNLTRQASLINEKLATLDTRKRSALNKLDDITEELDEATADNYSKEKQLASITSNVEGFEKSIELASTQITQNESEVLKCNENIDALKQKRKLLQKELDEASKDVAAALDKNLRESNFSKARLTSALEALPKVEEVDFIKAVLEFVIKLVSGEGGVGQRRDIEKRISENEASEDALHSRVKSLSDVNNDLLKKIGEYRETLSKLNINKAKMETSVQYNKQRIATLQKSLSQEKSHLDELDAERDGELSRKSEIDEETEGLQSDLSQIEVAGNRVMESLATLDTKIKSENAAVADKQSLLTQKQSELTASQSAIEKLALEINSADAQAASVKQNYEEQYGKVLRDEDIATVEGMSAASLRGKISTLRAKLDELGQVNLMASEEFLDISAQYETQKKNYDDTVQSMKDLERVAAQIRDKSCKMFLTTYNQIRKNFALMFQKLFGGGKAELKLENPDDLLSCGIDILAQPPGKALESISLLSGGERTMTAIALLFATYQVRPSPFCLLDEIDAALDDKNVGSFVATLGEFSSISQYIIITHNKKTAMCASSMFGVSMAEEGVSSVVSLKFADYMENPKATE